MTAAVVIPLRGGDHRTLLNLAELVDAAGATDVPVILADNGATEMVRTGLARVGVNQVVRVGEPGSYRARNAGVAAARDRGVSVVVFTDADCRPLPGWPGHLIDHCEQADAVVTVCPPDPTGLLGRGAHADYLTRLRAWAGGPLTCGAPIGTADTRALAVRTEVFDTLRFDDRLRYAADAVFGRQLLASGLRLVGCDRPCLAHDPPQSWVGEYRKYRRIAAELSSDLRGYPRRDVVRFLPEQAHLRRPPRRADRRRAAQSLLRSLVTRSDAESLYRSWRELAWQDGRWRGRATQDPSNPHQTRT